MGMLKMPITQKYVYICFCCVLGMGLTLSTTVLGEDDNKELARKHFKAGMSLLETSNYKVAAEEFESSIQLYPTKNGYFNLAACYFEINRMVDALTAVKRLKAEFKDELDDAWKSKISTFEEKLADAIVPVEFKTNIEKVTIELDGKKLDDATADGAVQYINPGEHQVTLSAVGYQTINEKINITAGQGRTIMQFVMIRPVALEGKDALGQNTNRVHFKNDKNGKPKKRKMLGTAIAFGIGGAAGLAAITTGVIHLVDVSKVHDICDGNYCEDQDLKTSVDKVRKLGVATNVLISVAAVGIVTGTIFAFVEGKALKKERRVSAAPTVWGDGGGLVLAGEF